MQNGELNRIPSTISNYIILSNTCMEWSSKIFATLWKRTKGEGREKKSEPITQLNNLQASLMRGVYISASHPEFPQFVVERPLFADSLYKGAPRRRIIRKQTGPSSTTLVPPSFAVIDHPPLLSRSTSSSPEWERFLRKHRAERNECFRELKASFHTRCCRMKF